MKTAIQYMTELYEQLQMKRENAIDLRNECAIGSSGWYIQEGIRKAYADMVIQLREELE